jgi:hypothetical protein
MEKKDHDLASVRHEDIESLAEKLDALAASMREGERVALARVILNAASVSKSESDPVLQFSGPLATSLAQGANFTKDGQLRPIIPISLGELRSKERVYFRGVTR